MKVIAVNDLGIIDLIVHKYLTIHKSNDTRSKIKNKRQKLRNSGDSFMRKSMSEIYKTKKLHLEIVLQMV
jgi:hypothetical protein